MKISCFLIIFAILFFDGCSGLFIVGQNQSQCASSGCDYSEAGVCDDMLSIYLNRHSLKNRKVKEGVFTDIDPYYDNKEYIK